MNPKRVALVAVVAVLLFDVWWRLHTIGPTVQSATGLTLWPVVKGEAEPLDCDESIYAYIGKRIASGDVMYRDLTENKPPGGYWLYALAVAIGGANETAIRLMPIPLVLATIALIGLSAFRLGGAVAAFVSTMSYALMSTDPFLYGNGANLEHAINLFATASLTLYLSALSHHSPKRLLLSGFFVGAAGLVKQVAVISIVPFALALLLPGEKTEVRPLRSRLLDLGLLLVGFSAAWMIAVGILVLQGSGRQAFEDIVRYGGALATETPPDRKEYPFLIRAFVGNTDPNGLLPWPFGKTLGRAWWAAGSYPLWAVSLATLPVLLLGRSARPGKLVAVWTIFAWVQVAMPRLFWQHYYLLPLPGVALCVGIALADAVRGVREGRWFLSLVWAATLIGGVVGTLIVEVRDYLLVEPNELTIRDKGGAQWVVLRDMGRELKRKTEGWDHPHLYIWGIQSPLYLYSQIDGVTPQVFADPLITAFAEKGHPLIRPRIERTMRDLRERRPELIYLGERPFPELLSFVRENYLQTTIDVQGRQLPGLWVRKDRLADFNAR